MNAAAIKGVTRSKYTNQDSCAQARRGVYVTRMDSEG